MTAMIEALSFLGPHGPVERDEQSCIYYDSLHDACLCWGTIQARTRVQLALACQRSMILAHQNFDATACFDGCHSITEILERLQRIRTDAVSLSHHWI